MLPPRRAAEGGPGIGSPRRSAAPAPASTATVLAVLFLAALSLRPQLVGVSPVLPDVQRDLGLSHAVAGLLGTIPVLCMGLFAPVAPIVAARVGTVSAVSSGVALIGIFGVLRAFAGDGLDLVVLTIGVGVGMGVAGALLPVVVKQQISARPVAGTVAYSAGLQLGSAASAGLAVPIALLLGGWRAALIVFSVAALAVLVPWVVVNCRGERAAPRLRMTIPDLADGRGWLLAGIFGLFGVTYYGWISWLPDAYAEMGWSPAAAGGLAGVLNVGSFVGALGVGAIAGRLLPFGRSLGASGAMLAAAAIGFVVLPAAGIGWALLGGLANGALFPLLLALPLRLTGSADRVAGLSSVMLGGGYTIAAIAPVALGGVRDATGSFSAGLAIVALIAVTLSLGLALVGRWREPGG